MKYKIADFKKELEELNYDHYINGVNNQGKFKTGIAAIIRKVYPEVAKQYEEMISLVNLGGVFLAGITGTTNSVVHAVTQDKYGYDGKQYASYDAIDSCFEKVSKFYNIENKSICYPLIGCGRGGLQWNVVKEIIDYRLKRLNHTCIVRVEDIIKYNIEEAIDQLWNDLGNIPVSEEYSKDNYSHIVIDEPFLHFEKGTNREDIWHWFEETFDIIIGNRYFS